MVRASVKIGRRLCACAAVLAWLLAPGSGLAAEDQPAGPPPLEIYHEPPDAAELPPPGELVSLPVQLLGTRDITMRMLALVTLDGKLLQAPLKNEYMNQYDRPEFSLTVAAPAAEMTYRFLLFPPDGQVQISGAYAVRRECRIPTAAADAQNYASLQGEQRLNALISTARSLKLEITAYDTAAKLLKDLQEMTKE